MPCGPFTGRLAPAPQPPGLPCCHLGTQTQQPCQIGGTFLGTIRPLSPPAVVLPVLLLVLVLLLVAVLLLLVLVLLLLLLPLLTQLSPRQLRCQRRLLAAGQQLRPPPPLHTPHSCSQHSSCPSAAAQRTQQTD